MRSKCSDSDRKLEGKDVSRLRWSRQNVTPSGPPASSRAAPRLTASPPILSQLLAPAGDEAARRDRPCRRPPPVRSLHSEGSGRWKGVTYILDRGPHPKGAPYEKATGSIGRIRPRDRP